MPSIKWMPGLVACLMAVAALVLGTVDSASSQTFEVLVDFAVEWPMGYNPQAGVILGADGNYYGTTSDGGEWGGGTIYRVTPGGVHTPLFDFRHVLHGNYPLAGVIQASDGHLYGAAFIGADPVTGGATVQGTIFRFTLAGEYTILHRIAGFDPALLYYPEGYYLLDPDFGPQSGARLLEVDGYLFGVTSGGGQFDGGTIFKITLAGAFSVVHHFGQNPTDGGRPHGGLTTGNDGRLYGTTTIGGPAGRGTVYSIDADGSDFTMHAWFPGFGVDGQVPQGPLALGTDGNFYGTAAFGGAQGGGTVFRFNPTDETLTVLHHMTPEGGTRPNAGLIQGSDGAFYGTASRSTPDANFSGTLFRITPTGVFTRMLNFEHPAVGNASAGSYGPGGKLLEVAPGTFIGTAPNGGPGGDGGVAFRFSLISAPTITGFSPTSGAIGSEVVITGTNLTGASAVAFNGTSATFIVDSATQLTATVPTGAISGTIEVTTPGGAATSATSFTVTEEPPPPPQLSLPGNIVTDATTPSGAMVTYTASATDGVGEPIPVSCTPASGSTFAIGTTTVACTATDDAGQSASGSFPVLVQAAAIQIDNLIGMIQSFNLAKGITNSLDAKLANALNALTAAKGGGVVSTCNQLTAFISETQAQSDNKLSVDQANQLITSANRIRAVIGCL